MAGIQGRLSLLHQDGGPYVHRMARAQDIVIRELRPTDADELERFYAELKPDTRCLRFCAASCGLSHDQSAWFCRGGIDRHGGLVATTRTSDMERIVGHLCIEPDATDRAEIAIVVADAMQHQGIGRRLAEAGIAWARSAGFTGLMAWVLIGNEPIRRLLTSLGLPSRTTSQAAGMWRIDIDLGPAPRLPASLVGEAGFEPATGGV